MLTRLRVRNFKCFESIDVELGNPVVFIGPNNSGKTTAMQALALWDLGLKRWHEKRGGQGLAALRLGVPINRKDAFALPHPKAAHYWRRTRVREGLTESGRVITRNIRIEIIVNGVRNNSEWECGLEFDYANEDQIYCRPLRLDDSAKPMRMPVPDEAVKSAIAYLPPMSGLVDQEPLFAPGSIDVRVGQGRTAEVLRNLCYAVYESDLKAWSQLTDSVAASFHVELQPPALVTQRGEITLAYKEEDVLLDISAAGRGLLQAILVLAYLYANPGAVLLIDEPDAHLEMLRQREIYKVVADAARRLGGQLIAASHSEVLLNEAAGKDQVISFAGQPQPLEGSRSQLLKSLRDIGADQYVLARQAGWVLYLEGSTDLAILQTFAAKLGRVKAAIALERPFVKYVGNQPSKAKEHFYGLQWALPDLKGVALYDRLDTNPESDDSLTHLAWKKREIENYLCSKRTLGEFAVSFEFPYSEGTLFREAEIRRRADAMRESIRELCQALETAGQGSPWDDGFKVSDRFLTPLFRNFYRCLELPNPMAKKSFHELAHFVPLDEIDPEIIQKLDAIADVAARCSAGAP